jgi:hypothetical protein
MPTLREYFAAADTASAASTASTIKAAESAKQAALDATAAQADVEILKAAEAAEVAALTKVGGVAFDPVASVQYTIVNGAVVISPAVTLDAEVRSDSPPPPAE